MNINQFNQMLGKELTGNEIKSFQIHSLALGRLINDAVFENEFKNNNFLIDEKVVAKKTKQKIPQLYKKNNKLDELALNTFLRQQGLIIDDLVNIIEFETRAEIFDELFFQIKLPNKINNKINIQNNHKRRIEFINLNLNQINLFNFQNNTTNKENEEVINYYNENINNYMSKETRDISYIEINKENYSEQFRPSENNIKKYYNENKNLYVEPEKRNFIQFNFKLKKDAVSFLKKIQNLKPKDIKKFAKENQTIFNEFNELTNNEVLDDLSNVIFEMNINEISQVIETPLAKHIVILTDIIPKKQQSFTESHKNIEKTLLSVELNNFFNELKDKVSLQILEGSNINEIAKIHNLKINYLKKINQFENNYENDLITNEIIRQSFISNKDFVSDLIDYDDQISFVFNVDNIYSSKPLEFNIVYEDVIKDFFLKKKIDFFNKDFNNNLNNKKYIDELTSIYSVKIKIKEFDKNYSELPIALINKIFNKKLNEIILHFEKDEVYIAKITNVKMPKISPENEKISLNSDLKNAFGNEIIKFKKISTNDNLINAILNQY